MNALRPNQYQGNLIIYLNERHLMTEHQSVEIGELLGVNAVIAPLGVAVPVPIKLSHL